MILAAEPLTTPDGATYRFLIRWRDRPPSDDSWVLATELQLLDVELLRRYLSAYASEIRDFEWGSIDVAAPLPLLDDDPFAEAQRHKDLRCRDDAEGRPRYNLRTRRAKSAVNN
ncbi:hypothetical protein KSP40_PGU000151 [Platanthera guangdongensis]|uniref:Chromo domain-containing protein n=1 Tax=Platanthera guangdongensis TaxID=2320717 RepID=A0ABR2LM04_9ASPA